MAQRNGEEDAVTYVDLMSDVRWSEADHVAAVEASVRSQVTHTREHVLLRRTIALVFYILSQMLPAGALQVMCATFGRPLDPAPLAELTAAAAVFLAADTLATQARGDGALLNAALDYEGARTTLAALPPPPTDGSPDTAADQRTALQAQLAAAGADTLALVAQRDAYRASLNPPPEVTP
jgi:hypothetical protein